MKILKNILGYSAGILLLGAAMVLPILGLLWFSGIKYNSIWALFSYLALIMLLESKGFYEPVVVQDFPIRGKKLFLMTLELETYLTDRVALLLNARERALFGSDIGKFHTQVSLGLKFIIN